MGKKKPTWFWKRKRYFFEISYAKISYCVWQLLTSFALFALLVPALICYFEYFSTNGILFFFALVILGIYGGDVVEYMEKQEPDLRDKGEQI